MISRGVCALLSVSWCGGAIAGEYENEGNFPFIHPTEKYEGIFERNIKNDPKSKIERVEEEKKLEKFVEKNGDSSKDSPPNSPKNESITFYEDIKNEALYFLTSEDLTVGKYLRYAYKSPSIHQYQKIGKIGVPKIWVDLGKIGIPKNWQQNSINIKIPVYLIRTGKVEEIPFTITYNAECGKAIYKNGTLKSMPLLDQFLQKENYFERLKIYDNDVETIEAVCSLVKYVFTTYELNKTSKFSTFFMKSSTIFTPSEILDHCINQGHCTEKFIEQMRKESGAIDAIQILNYIFTKKVKFEQDDLWKNTPLKFKIKEEENTRWIKEETTQWIKSRKSLNGVLNGLVDSEGGMIKEIFGHILSYSDIKTFFNLRFISTKFNKLTQEFPVNGILDFDKAFEKILPKDYSEMPFKYKNYSSEMSFKDLKKLFSEVKFKGIKASFGLRAIEIYDKNKDEEREEKIRRIKELEKEADESDRGKKLLFSSFSKFFKGIQFLYLQGPLITDDFLKEVIKNFINIETLIVDSENIKDITYFEGIKKLKQLSLGNRFNKIITEYPKISNDLLIKFINDNLLIKNLDLYHFKNLDDDSIKEILDKNQNIEFLNLGLCTKLTKKSLNLISKNLKNIKYLDVESLRSIEIFGTKEEISETIPTLKFLNLDSDIDYEKKL